MPSSVAASHCGWETAAVPSGIAVVLLAVVKPPVLSLPPARAPAAQRAGSYHPDTGLRHAADALGSALFQPGKRVPGAEGVPRHLPDRPHQCEEREQGQQRKKLVPIAAAAQGTSLEPPEQEDGEQRRKQQRGSSSWPRNPSETIAGVIARVEKTLLQKLHQAEMLAVRDAYIIGEHQSRVLPQQRRMNGGLPEARNERVPVEGEQTLPHVRHVHPGQVRVRAALARRKIIAVFALERRPIDPV